MKNVKELFNFPVSIYPAGWRHSGRRDGNNKRFKIAINIVKFGDNPDNIIATIEAYEVVPSSGSYVDPFVVPNRFKLCFNSL